MILADKIIGLRKKAGMTQEDLAAEMNVSRQSVSKWESAISMPDLDKIVKLSKIFGVSTDFLLDESKGMDQVIYDEREIDDGAIIVDIDKLNGYYEAYENIAKSVALAFLIIISSPIAILLLDEINENLGLVIFLAMVALAIGLFINAGFNSSKVEFIEKESYDFSYGIEGIIEKNLEEYIPNLKRNVIIAVAIFILAPALYILLENVDISDSLIASLFLILIGIGSALISYCLIKYSSYSDILKFRDPMVQKKEGKLSKASGILWILAIGIYLVYSFKTGSWATSWIVFIVAGVIQTALAIYFD